MQLNFKAPTVLGSFMRANGRTRVIKGPVGSGKSSGCAIEVFRRACAQAPDRDGIRRSKFAVVRNTMPMLRDTTIPTFLDWFPHGTLGKWYETAKTYHFRFNDVDCLVLFRALDDRDDVSKLLSLELTGCWFNEFREIDPSIFEGMSRRVGRYPSKKNGPGPSWYGIWCDTNPPQIGSWHYQMMEKELPNSWEIFHQPSGRSTEAENVENLPEGYYSTDGLSEEYVRVMIDGEYGYDQSGLPIFKSTFHKPTHVAQAKLGVVRGDAYPLIVAFDAGLTPAALIAQQDYRNRVNIVGECFCPRGQSMGMDQFMVRLLMPYLTNRFPNMAYRGVIDPAAKQRSQANEQTPFDMVKKYFKVFTAATNKFERRVAAGEQMLMRFIDGKPALQIDPSLEHIVNALSFGYRYGKQKDTADPKDTPEKNHYSHIGDAFQYLCVYLLGSAGLDQYTRRREVTVATARGWT